MKEPYREGIAHHSSPESWGGAVRYPLGGLAAQALTGEHASRVLSREIDSLWGASGVVKSLRLHRYSQNCARLCESHAVIDLERAWTPTTRNPGDPVVFQADGRLGRVGNPQGIIR